MASSDYDRPVASDDRIDGRREVTAPVDSTAPPVGAPQAGFSTPLGIVLAILVIGLLLLALRD